MGSEVAMKKPIKVCWDSCVLIGIIKGKTDVPNDLNAANDVLQHADKGHCQLVFSALIYPEVLKTGKNMPSDSEEQLEHFLMDREKRPVIATDISIAREAQRIRNETKLKTPDAIHVATAIATGASVLHTFDKEILKLDKHPAMKDITITKCTLP